MSNHLANETSPYLLQHAENPVDWYPWCEEAFRRAEAEDKPVFLSIGYSTCHWCHVMARESFEDREIADILNRYFISVKVDREERPDIDSVYMPVCQAFTGSGGWPASIFMTAGQKPFFAGTYFPKTSRRGMTGLRELLQAIHARWEDGREDLLRSADEITEALNRSGDATSGRGEDLAEAALEQYRRSFDRKFGGFGPPPKFPAPHNLLFLMQQYEKHGDPGNLEMAELTLRQMYAGGLFDHIGYGFCRYSTDRACLVPHFEKMLYDNALLILAYCKAYELTGKAFYRKTGEKTAWYVLNEMTSPDGGFYSAQDADSGGEEGKYYLFTPDEIVSVLGSDKGEAFCRRFDITEAGNFEGKSIPNLLRAPDPENDMLDSCLPALRSYRQRRAGLHTDDKILTAWNSLMIAALCRLYRCTGDRQYLEAAQRAQAFIEDRLCLNGELYVSFRAGRLGERGFLDDYAGYILALLSLYDATLDSRYPDRACELARRTADAYVDNENGGFYLYGSGHEKLIFRPKECYDGAMPSGNSLMAYDLVRLRLLAPDGEWDALLKRQLDFLSGIASGNPSGFAMFLIALSDYAEPPCCITAVRRRGDGLCGLPLDIPSDAAVRVLDEEEDGYKLLNGETALYVCRDHSCLPPVNLHEFRRLNLRKAGK